MVGAIVLDGHDCQTIFTRLRKETKIQNGKFCKEMSPTNILPKTNITPENRPSQKESSLPNTNFQELCEF